MSTIETKIVEWLESNITQVTQMKPRSIHIDELLGEKWDSKTVIANALSIYKILIDNIEGNMLIETMPLLTLPLEPISKFVKTAVSWENCNSAVSDEPPSIYLIDRNNVKFWDDCEEYRIPIKKPNIDTRKGELFSYYRIYRNNEAIENNWEYERCIYTELYVKPFI